MAQVGDQKGFCASSDEGRRAVPHSVSQCNSTVFVLVRGWDGFLRALTPLECERRMGLPENWTKYGCKNEEISDHARYRALGNSIALPQNMMAGIAEVMN